MIVLIVYTVLGWIVNEQVKTLITQTSFLYMMLSIIIQISISIIKAAVSCVAHRLIGRVKGLKRRFLGKKGVKCRELFVTILSGLELAKVAIILIGKQV